MRTRLLLIAALMLLPATAAGAAATVFNVRSGAPMKLVAALPSRGDSISTTRVIGPLDGALTAVDVQPGLRAETATIVRRPGQHHG